MKTTSKSALRHEQRTSRPARRRIRIVSVIGVALLAFASVIATNSIGAIPAVAAPGSPGVTQPGTTIFSEDFEGSASVLPQTLTDYVGTNGETYTADPGWLENCNGQVRSYLTPSVLQGNCPSVESAAQSDQLAYALGDYEGAGAIGSLTNHALTAFTDGIDPGAGVELRTVRNIPVSTGSGRFLTLSVNTAAINCGASAPLYQFAFVTATGAEINVGGEVNACESTDIVTAPSVGTEGPLDVRVGTYVPDGSVLFTEPSLGFLVRNLNGSATGNDAAIDDIRIIDVTPQLDKSFDPALVTTGGTSRLTFTITNTSELASKNGWSFSDALPAGLTVAADPAVATTCQAGVVTAVAGAGTVAATGNLAAGMPACTVSVGVTSATPGTYTNGAANVTTTGLNAPGSASVTFEHPSLSLTKQAAPPVDVNHDGITDVGDTIQYDFVVTNNGDVPLTNVAVTDSKVGAVSCPSAALAVGATEMCTAGVYTITTADATAGAVTNTATASGTSPADVDVESPPSSTSTPAALAAPRLTLVKTAELPPTPTVTPGQNVTFHFTVTNSGNLGMSDIGVVEGAFNGTGTLSPAVCPSATLAAGAQEVCSATYTLTEADVDRGGVTNTATASGIPTGSTTAISSDPSTVTVLAPAAPAITLTKTAEPGTIDHAGALLRYSFLVTNTGNVTLSAVKVAEGDFSGTGTLVGPVCPDTTLAFGASMTCTATYVATQADVDAGHITNTATATGTPPAGGAPVSSAASTAVVSATALPGLRLVKTADAQVIVAAGQVIHYSFTVTNTGNVTVTNPGVVEGTFTGHGALSSVVCPPAPDALAPGASTVCTASYTVVSADLADAQLSNTAIATGTVPAGNTILSDPSTVAIPVASPIAPVSPSAPSAPSALLSPFSGYWTGAQAGAGVLAHTGVDIPSLAVPFAVLLLLLGVALLVVRRRRRRGTVS